MSDSLRPYGCTVQGILQARIPEWVAFPICGVSAQPRDQAQVSPIAGRFFSEAEAPVFWTPDAKNRLIEKDSDAGKALKAGREGRTEAEMVASDYQLNGDEFEQTLGDSEG